MSRRTRVVFATLVAGCVWAQGPATRDGYRNAYRSWKQADPNLERDAAAGGASVPGRAEAMAAGAAGYTDSRKEFLTAWLDEVAQRALSLEDVTAIAGVEPSRAVAKSGQEIVTAQTTTVDRMIAAFAGDPDAGIQQLRLALEREKASLTALSDAIALRQKALGAGVASASALEAARAKAADPYRKIAAAAQEAVSLTDRQGAALADYYRKVAQAATGVAAPGPATVGGNTAGGNTAGPATAPGPTRPVERDPTPGPRTPSITPVPMVRYTGAWVFPAGGVFAGAQPEFLDLVVHEENGQCRGTLFARFKLPAGSTGDPVLRFDFSGEFKNTRRQSFTLVTSDGANGTIELIPGSAFNLLEVNFQTEARPGKVRTANVVLVKK